MIEWDYCAFFFLFHGSFEYMIPDSFWVISDLCELFSGWVMGPAWQKGGVASDWTRKVGAIRVKSRLFFGF